MVVGVGVGVIGVGMCGIVVVGVGVVLLMLDWVVLWSSMLALVSCGWCGDGRRCLSPSPY